MLIKKIPALVLAFIGFWAVSYAQETPIHIYSNNPSFILCTTKRSIADPFPVVRVMYLTKMQMSSGTIESIFYETVPKPASEAGHSEHFLVKIDLSGRYIISQIPLDDEFYPDCTRGTTLSDLVSRGQTAKFEQE